MLELAENATVPVINALTKLSHPCQIMADVLTFEEHRGPIQGRTVAWSGDANNVLASWVHAAARFDFTLNVACPPELAPPPALMAWARAEGARVNVTADAFAAVERRRRGRHRLLGLDGRRGRGPPPQPARRPIR